MRPEFGATWADLIRDWCLGTEPEEPPFTAWLALESLDRLWPEYVDRIIASTVRGSGVIVAAIHFGGVLRACEPLFGFGDVIRRARGGEHSAVAELEVAASLVRAGYVPALEPAVGNNRVDASVIVNGITVYIEVISPERSDVMIEAHAALGALAARLRDENHGKKIEVLLAADVNDALIETVCRFVSQAPFSGNVQDVPGIGSVIVEPSDRTLVVSPRIAVAGDTAVLGSASGASHDGTIASVRMPVTDRRIQRLLTAELHHFSRDEVNLLVIDVTRCAGSIRSWTPLVERRFQPNQNQRLGGAVIFQLVATDPAIKHRWSALPNPHARRPVPEALLGAFDGLNA